MSLTMSDNDVDVNPGGCRNHSADGSYIDELCGYYTILSLEKTLFNLFFGMFSCLKMLVSLTLNPKYQIMFCIKMSPVFVLEKWGEVS